MDAASEFVVHETGSVALYYPRESFSVEAVRRLAGLSGRKPFPMTHPTLGGYLAAQVESQSDYIVLRFRRSS